MLVIAIASGLVLFLLMYAIYNYIGNESISISKRVKGFGMQQEPAIRRGGRGGFWNDLAGSKVSTWARIGAGRFGGVLPKQSWFELQAARAGLPVTGGELIMLIFGSTVAVALLTALVTINITRTLIAGFSWAVFCVIYLQVMANRRMRSFDNQLGDAIVMMSNALKAGFTFQQAMEIVSKELSDPISTEFGRALNEIQLGVPMETALNSICSRIESEDFELVVTAVVIQRQVGGNLAQIMDTIGATIRERIKMKGEVKALTTEGVYSGYALSFLPIGVAMICMFFSPGYFDGMLKEPFGKVLLVGSLISELIGILVIKRIVSVRI